MFQVLIAALTMASIFQGEKCNQDIAVTTFHMHDCTLQTKTKAITSELSSLMSSQMQHIQAIVAIFE